MSSLRKFFILLVSFFMLAGISQAVVVEIEIEYAPGDLSNTTTLGDEPVVYPNPYKIKSTQTEAIVFSNLSASKTKIDIFTLSGRLVREIEQDPVDGKISWNIRDKSNNKISSGVYLYSVSNAAGKKAKGKIAIIK
jgi:hypothetical protein